MTTKSKHIGVLNQSTPTRHTYRIFIDVPDEGWKLIGGTRSKAIPSELLYLPAFAGKTVRAAIANINVKRGKPITLNSLRIESWKIGENGNADWEQQVQLVIARVLAEEDNYPSDIVATDEDIDAISRTLGLDS